MIFEMFDRNVAAVTVVEEAPLIRVDALSRLLFNAPAWEFLAMQAGDRTWGLEVALLFDAENRTVGVRPVTPLEVPEGARWTVVQMRSLQWPRAIAARLFLEHYQVAVGEYRAKLMRGPGPRMVTFEVATLRPAAATGGGEGEDDPR